MKLIDQTIVDPLKGNCHAACIASLFDLDLDQVPNLIKFTDNTWYSVYWYFCRALGYELVYIDAKRAPRPMKEYPSIDGYYIASIASKTFPDKSHAIIVDGDGNVIHDPNPNKLYQGINVLNEIIHWDAMYQLKADNA